MNNLIELIENKWQSDFFNKRIGTLLFTENDNQQRQESDFDLIECKVSSEQFQQINWLQKMKFQWVEGEVVFCLPVSDLSRISQMEHNICDEIAKKSDIFELQNIFKDAFINSRFRSPWFSLQQNNNFYATWIANAVNGEFDDLCLVSRDIKGDIVGGISLRKVGEKTAQVGLLAIKQAERGKKIGRALLASALHWCANNDYTHLYIATQFNNIAAINLYSNQGAKVEKVNYWFYKTIAHNN